MPKERPPMKSSRSFWKMWRRGRFPSPIPLASCDVAKRLECGVSRRLSLANSQGARLTNSSATTKAAGYGALQTLSATWLRLGHTVLYRRFVICKPHWSAGASGIFVALQNAILRYDESSQSPSPTCKQTPPVLGFGVWGFIGIWNLGFGVLSPPYLPGTLH